MLFRPCADKNADFCCVIDFVVVVVVVVNFFFFLEERPLPFITFFAYSPDIPSFLPLSSFLIFFSYYFVFLAIAAATCCVMDFLINSASIDISPSNSTAISSAYLFTF